MTRRQLLAPRSLRTCAFACSLVAAGALAGCGDDGPTDPATACLALLDAPPAPDSLRVTVDGPRILDELGREVLLRGVNTGGRAKLPPFFAFPFAESGTPGQDGASPFDEALGAYLDRVASWGHNVIRLPFSWEALEPVRGAWDEGYLDRYEAIVVAAGARNLRVIVDFHQDVSFAFDREARTGQLVFEAAAGGVSELRVPERLYAGEVATSVAAWGEVAACAVHDRGAQVVRVATTGATTVTVDFGP